MPLKPVASILSGLNSAYQQSLRRQLLSGFSALVLGMLLISSLGIGYLTTRNEQRAWRDRQIGAARYTSDRVSAFLEQQESTLKILAQVNWDELHGGPDFLHAVLAGQPVFLEVAYLDAQGGIFTFAQTEFPILVDRPEITKADWYREALAGSTAYSEVQISPQNEPYLIVAHPSRDGGVVAARLDMVFLWQVVSESHFGAAGSAYLVNRQGSVIAHPDPQVVLQSTTIAGRPGLQELLLIPGAAWYRQIQGIHGDQVVGAVAPVRHTGWLVITEMPAWEAFRTSRDSWVILLLGVLFLYFSMFRLSARLLERLVLQPLYRLQNGARQFGQGNFAYRVELSREDELGQLAAAFNQMAASLAQREDQLAAQTAALMAEVAERKQAQADLHELNERLEERVRERTQELTRVNSDLIQEVGERELAEEALQRKSYQQERLFETARHLAASLDLEQVLRRVGSSAKEILDAQGCTIYSLGDDGRTLIPVVAIDPEYEQEILATSILIDSSLNGKAIQERRGLVFNTPTRAESSFQIPGTPVDEDERVIVAPLIVDEHILGTICINRMGGVNYTEEDLALAETFAAYASTAVKNALAHDQLQQEVEERKRIEAALRESEERYALATRGANDGLWDWNLKDNLIYYSPRWKSILGYTDGAIGDRPEEWFERIHPEDQEQVKLALAGHLQGRTTHFESEHRMLHKDGTYRWVLARGIAVRAVDLSASSPTHAPALGPAHRLAGSMTDITSRKHAEEQLLHDAFHDHLTGLPNRALFLDRLGRTLERANRRSENLFAVLILDLDRFKVVNDSLGHTSGDQLLVAIAARLHSCIRAMDTAARLGGDEFVLLLEEINDPSDAIHVAGRIRDELKQPYRIDGREIITTASIGIVLGGPGYERPADVLRDSDIALYRAKALGKDRYVIFDPSLRALAMARLELESELRGALERQELELHYQAIRALHDHRISGFEALLRWRSPSRGYVPPDEFIPVAEETGMIGMIGEWVLRQACRQLRRWQDRFPADPPLTVNVNISGVQFANPLLVEQVQQALQDSALDPRCLRLEITESVFMENAEQANSILLKLRSLGVQIQIDDFGTGYSSLSYLQRFPISTIKIDRSFVSQMGLNGDNAEIVKNIVLLARDLGMDTVAEGIETEEQLAQLKALDCSYGQGYLIAEPIDDRGIETLLMAEIPPPDDQIAMQARLSPDQSRSDPLPEGSTRVEDRAARE